MSILKKTLREPGGRRSFPLFAVILLGLATGIFLVAAVLLFIAKVPSEMLPVISAAPSAADAGPFERARRGNIIPPSDIAENRKAPAQQAAASSAPIKTEAAVRQDTETAVRMAVEQWAEAWSRRDVASYLACYADDYVPDGMSRATWEARRKLRISRPRSIKVELRQVEVSVSPDGIASARFVQDFRADNYRETGVRKELRLKNEHGRWLIVGEKAV